MSVSNPFGFGNLVCAMDRHLRGAVEIVISGTREDPRTRALISAARKVYLPNRALVMLEPGVARIYQRYTVPNAVGWTGDEMHYLRPKT